MKTIVSFSLLTLGACLAACAGSASDSAPGPTSSATQASRAEPVADLTGTWGFVLASSDVAAPIRERCEKSGAGDTAKTKECLSEIATQAAREKIRFSKDPAGTTVWTSFESDSGKELVYVQVPVELAADGPGHVLAKVSGAPKGELAAQFEKSSVNVMRIEVVDARTIAMTDPKKGRLVYTKE